LMLGGELLGALGGLSGGKLGERGEGGKRRGWKDAVGCPPWRGWWTKLGTRPLRRRGRKGGTKERGGRIGGGNEVAKAAWSALREARVPQLGGRGEGFRIAYRGSSINFCRFLPELRLPPPLAHTLTTSHILSIAFLTSSPSSPSPILFCFSTKTSHTPCDERSDE